MRKLRKKISFLMIFVIAFQCLNLTFVNAETIDVENDAVISGSALEIADTEAVDLLSDSTTSATVQDIVLVLDDSGSMSSSQMDTLKEAAIKFSETVLNANVNNRIGIVYFSKHLIYNFSSNLDEIKNNINNAYSYSSTPIDEGIYSADTMFTNSWNENSVKSMVIMSDGEPDSERDALNAFNSVKDKYSIYSVYLGTSNSARSFMESIQNRGFFYAENIDSLIEQFGKIAEEILYPLEIDLSNLNTLTLIPDDEPLMNVKLTAKISNYSKVSAKNAWASISLPSGVTCNDALKINLGEIESNGTREIIWETFAKITAEDRDITYVVTAGAENTVSMEQYITVKIESSVKLNNEIKKEDMWGFTHSSVEKYDIDKNDLNYLLSILNNKESEIISKQYKEMTQKGYEWGGSCFGMSISSILFKIGKMIPSNIKQNINTVNEFKIDDVRSLINYYHIIQNLDFFVDQENSFKVKSTKAKAASLLEALIDFVDGGKPILVCFSFQKRKLDENNEFEYDWLGNPKWVTGGHAIIADGYKTFDQLQMAPNGFEYNIMIKTYDVNSSEGVYNIDPSDYYIYMNTSTGEITIPKYDDKKMYKNTILKLVKTDFNDFYNYDYTKKNYVSDSKRNIQARARAYSLLNFKMKSGNGKWIEFNNNEEINKDGYVVSFGNNYENSENQFMIIDLPTLSGEYQVMPVNKGDSITIGLDFENYLLNAESNDYNIAKFDTNGNVEVDNNGKSKISLTTSDNITNLPWFTISAESSEKGTIGIKDKNNAIILYGDNLNNVKIQGNNKTETKELTFDSDKTSVLITNEDNDLVVKEDTDGDGNYEKPIADSEGNYTGNENTTTTESTTEITTSKLNYSSPSGGGGGGGSYKKAVTTTESTTESVTTEKTTETTTEEKAITNEVRVTIGSNLVTVGNKTYAMDVTPYIQPESNSTLVPLRFAAIAISGGDVENADSSSIVGWDANTKTASITAGGKVIKFTAGSELMYIGNTPIVMENGVKAEIQNGRMFIPFRALGKALGVKVDWDADTKTAIYSVI